MIKEDHTLLRMCVCLCLQRQSPPGLLLSLIIMEALRLMGHSLKEDDENMYYLSLSKITGLVHGMLIRGIIKGNLIELICNKN